MQIESLASNLTESTCFMRVKFGIIGNSKSVMESILTTDADTDLLKVSKKLLDSKELEAIKKADNQFRQYLYSVCLPYDIGCMLLPNGLVETVDGKAKEFAANREALVEAFIVAYPGLCQVSASRLGSLFAAGDYKHVEALKEKFTFGYNFLSFGIPAQLANINQDIFEEAKVKSAQILEDATEQIVLLMRSQLFELTSKLQDKLQPGPDGKAKVLRESAIQNIKDFLGTFEMRNVTNDQELAQEVTKIKAILAGVDAGSLKSSAELKASLAEKMSEITDSLGSMIETRPTRKFRIA